MAFTAMRDEVDTPCSVESPTEDGEGMTVVVGSLTERVGVVGCEPTVDLDPLTDRLIGLAARYCLAFMAIMQTNVRWTVNSTSTRSNGVGEDRTHDL